MTSLYSLEKRVENLIEQIVPTQHLQRNRRGLFNPLGSFIKCITGNLDQTDAEQIDAKIKNLQENQNKLRIDAINQITLLDSTINKFKTIISNITHNESILKTRILQIEETIKKVEIHQTDLHEYYLIFNIINQVTLMYQSIYNILDKIEVAITFAKINVPHNSIIDPNDLLKEIKDIHNHLSSDKLPLEANSQNILNFERILVIKSFQKGFNIVFILELPLVESETYQYFNLYPLPIPNNQSFFANIPYKPYLALSSRRYAYMDQRCSEIQSQNYLCKRTRTASVEDNPSCAVQLIRHNTNITSCHPIEAQLHEIQSTQIIDGKWLITVPTRTISTINCQKSVDNTPLYGSYLLESPIGCQVRIKSTTFETYKPNRLTFSKVSLPIMNLNLVKQHQSISYNPPTMDLNYVNLKATKEIEKKLEEQKEDLQEMTTTIYVSRTSFWTILLYIIILLTIIYLLYYKFVKKSKKSKIDPNNDSNTDIF